MGDAAASHAMVVSARAGSPRADAAFARLAVTGDGVPATPICTFRAPSAFTYDWVDANFAGGETIMTMGVIRANAGPLSTSSVLVWYSLVAPEQTFELHVREVFARMLVALIPGRGVVLTPTPTP